MVSESTSDGREVTDQLLAQAVHAAGVQSTTGDLQFSRGVIFVVATGLLLHACEEDRTVFC